MANQDSIVTTRTMGTIAVVMIDNPPVNALGHPVRSALLTALKNADGDQGISGIVIACAGRTFAAGADIAEFGKPPASPTLRELVAAVDRLEKPTLAALHGNALGGGLELALCCRYRIAGPGTRLGLPEVKIGLIPGSGGTVRLPYLIGPAAALEMMASGAPVTADEALSSGLIDAIAHNDLIAEAVSMLEKRVAEGAVRHPIGIENARVSGADMTLLEETIAHVTRRARGLEAPMVCIEAVSNAMTMPFADALTQERVLFDRLVSSEQSRALRHLFFAERKAAKGESSHADTLREVTTVGVIGAGTMGGGIAMAFANAGLPVTLLDVNADALARGRETIGKNYSVSVERGSMDAATARARQDQLSFTTDLGDLAACDLIVEAAFEDMAVKKELFTKLDIIARPGTILATNTSYLDVDEIAAATARPKDVIGMHFFSPANVMKLLEVVKARKTAPDVLATALALGKRMGKTPVVVGVCHGFVGNRMLGARSSDMIDLLLEGATPAAVDKVFTDFGWPMGPFQMQDLAGLDIGWRNRKALGETLAIADDLCEMGHFGQKTGRGYYRYEPGSRKPIEDPDVAALITRTATSLGLERREISTGEIIERTHYPLVNEGARILGEGIAARSSDIDVVWTNGFGFPKAKGGPMFWAQNLGLETIISRLEYWYAQNGKAVFKPSQQLREMARQQAK